MDQFHIVINNPRLMIRFVNILRQHNAQIEKNKYEEEKANRVLRAKESDHELAGLNDLIDRFKDDPYEFENFCARLYQLMGIDAEKTSNSNDGGYDIVLHIKMEKRHLLSVNATRQTRLEGL